VAWLAAGDHCHVNAVLVQLALLMDVNAYTLAEYVMVSVMAICAPSSVRDAIVWYAFWV
jgi:hypothetical protein